MSADERFDAVTRAAAEGVSRRQIMRMLAGGLAGGTLLTGLSASRARGAGRACVEQCRFLTGRQRGDCLRTCNSCTARGGQMCLGGTGAICCESDADCCNSNVGQVCCPAGSHCCIGRNGNLSCCPDSTECCGNQCCAPGQCCETGLPFSVVCCPPGETCCFDPDEGPGLNRCGTIDPATGNCAAR